jgi:hypothetical protein
MQDIRYTVNYLVIDSLGQRQIVLATIVRVLIRRVLSVGMSSPCVEIMHNCREKLTVVSGARALCLV